MASELTNFPRETTMREIANALNTIAIVQAGANDSVESWAAVKQLVRQGLGAKAFPIGTQFTAAHSVYGTILFDVVDHDGYKKPGDDSAHTMTLLMHDCIYNRQVDNMEALYAVNADVWPDGLPAGTYNFTLLSGYDTAHGGGATYQFTTTQVVPVGGVIMFPWVYNTQVSATKVSTYASCAATTAIESGLAVAAGSEGTSLGTADGNTAHMNHTYRIRFGSNHWGESALRQWLNSDGTANAWWTPQTEFDRPASYASTAGFLNGLDANFLSVVGEVDVTTAYNTVYNANGVKQGTYTTRDRFFLPSRVELGYGAENSISEGTVFALYDGAEDADRIKYDISAKTTARYWWMRSPNPGHASHVRYVAASGALGSYIANNGDCAAAACVIY